MRAEVGIAWDWTEAGRGALCALPGAVVLITVDVAAGMVAALATVIVALAGVPPRRRQRIRLLAVGVAFSVAYAAGSIVGHLPAAAVAALTLLAYAAVVLAARTPAALLLPAIVVPGFALGMNHLAPDGFALAAVFLGGSAWATCVTYLWPEREPPAPAADAPAGTALDTRLYAAAVAAAAGVGLALGYVLDLAHVAWAAAAALFVMRPDPHVLVGRTFGRVLATFAGVAAAGLLVRRGPTEVVLAVVTVAAVAAVVAVRSSRWYVTSAGTGLLVLLASGTTGGDAFSVTFAERLGETALGAGLAVAFGVAVPLALHRLAPGVARRSASPTMEA